MAASNELAQRLGPGFWVDRDGAMHVSVPELLQLFELPETPENINRVTKIALETLGREAPEIRVEVREFEGRD